MGFYRMFVEKRSSKTPVWGIILRLGLAFMLLFTFVSADLPARAQEEIELSALATLPQGAADGMAVWGDIDNDNDQDLLITGRGNNEAMTTLLFRNTDGTLSAEGNAGLANLESSSIALGDYDNDGDLDVLLTGQGGVNLSGEIGFSAVYQNDGSGSFAITHNLTGVYRGSADWGDYDLDGDLDILLSGYLNGGNGFGAVYRNDGGAFTIDSSIDVPNVGDSFVSWADYDADKDLDFAILGKYCETCNTRVAQVLRNNGSGYFFPINLVSTGLWNGAAVWIDVDKDGDLDLIMSGNGGPDSFNRDPLTLLFTYNYSTGLTLASGTNLPGLWQTSIAAGDYDNDGDSDLLLTGLDLYGHMTRLYTNQNGVFTNANLTLASGTGASVAWGKLNSDNNLDFIITGVEDSGTGLISTYSYVSTPAVNNTLPNQPAIVSACWDGQSKVILDWTDASDGQTPSPSLLYSVRIGTGPGMGNISAPPAGSDGYRRISIPDGSSAKSQMLLKAPVNGTYQWAVQAVDSAYNGSPFSAEGTFIVGTYLANNDTYWVAQTGETLLPVLENDNPDYNDLIVKSVQDPSHGWAAIEGTNISYTPDTGWSGSETFEYYALSTNTGYCSRGFVTVQTPGVFLSPSSVREGQVVGTEVGVLSTTDPDSSETFSFSLVSGTGSQDNASFSINGNKVLTAAVFDYSVQNSFTIRVQATGSAGSVYTQAINITVSRESLNPPADIILSYNSIQENVSTNSTVGAFSCADQDPENWCLFNLVNGPGSDDNSSFSINWIDLRTRYVFDYETKNSYSIRIRATDNTGLWIEKVFNILVINLSDSAPTDVFLNNSFILQNLPVNTEIGAFTSIDSDPADTFRYRLVSGDGSTDNASFNISGNILRSSAVFDYSTQNTYTIRVRTTDQTDRYMEKVFTIRVLERSPNPIFFPFASRKK